MADFILIRKSKNIASSAVHVLLNILLGLVSVLITVFSGSMIPGIVIVLLSKWRTFAVRKRYLWLNIKSNLVDVIVGISVVLLAYYSGNTLTIMDFGLIAIYIIWLLFIKPMSSENANLLQSLIAVFLGISATSLLTANAGALMAVFLSFLVGYAASRHVLAQTNDRDFTLTTLVCGLIFAEIAWLCHTWFIVYSFGDSGVRIPQSAVILTIFAFIYNYVRQVYIKMGSDFKIQNVLGPMLFSVALIFVIVLWFSEPVFNI